MTNSSAFASASHTRLLVLLQLSSAVRINFFHVSCLYEKFQILRCQNTLIKFKIKPYDCTSSDTFSAEIPLAIFLKRKHISRADVIMTETKKDPVSAPYVINEISLNSNLKASLRTQPYITPSLIIICQQGFPMSADVFPPVQDKPLVCQKEFTQQSLLMNHPRTHTGDNLHVCNVCQKAFSSAGNLKTHLRIHSGEKSFVCEICQKGFTQFDTLKLHLRTHTKEKPYVCPTCQKVFSQSSGLKAHLRTHTGEKPYVCAICQKAFSHSSSMKVHLRCHTKEKPHVCDVCQKAFSSANNLNKHLRIHSGEKSFVCEICQKRFTRLDTLKSHLRTHTKEKPYVCSVCQKGFSQLSNVKKHFRLHTRVTPVRVTPVKRPFVPILPRESTGEKNSFSPLVSFQS